MFRAPERNPANKIEVIAGIEFQELAITLTFQLGPPYTLSGILLWLGGLIPDNLRPVEDLLKKDNIFEHFKLRRMTIGLNITEDKDKPKLSNFGIDIEVSATFGRGSDRKPVVFLVTYTWTEQGGKLGLIRGQLWNCEYMPYIRFMGNSTDRRANAYAGFDPSSDRDLSPYYEQWTDLQPITEQTPATSINLVSIIPGQNIENIPDNIPTEITRAYILLSEDTFAIGGTVTATRVSQGAIPQPYLGQVKLDASYSWGNSSAFKLSFGIMSGLQPSPTSEDYESAALIGQLDYDYSLKTWELKATLDGLYGSALYEFFDSSSAKHVMPLIDSIAINNMTLDYEYGPVEGKSVGSYFKISGVLLVAALELDLKFEYKDDWTFTAVLKSQDTQATLGDIIASILGDDQLDIPEFLANMQFGGEGGAQDTLTIDVHKEKGTGSDIGTGSFHFIAEVAIPLALTFAQYHSSDWLETVPSK